VFHQKYLLSHQQIFSALEKYVEYLEIKKEENALNQISIKIKLNDYGRLQVWQSRFLYFKTDDNFLGKNKNNILVENSLLNFSAKSLKYINSKIDKNILLACSNSDTNN
jgi:hypothetical protein